MDDLSFLASRLSAAGLRLTAGREAVYRYFAGPGRGRSLAEAAAHLASAEPGAGAESGIGPATVYRAAKTLAGLGCLRAVAGDGGGARYCAVGGGHVHLVSCTGCGRTVPFEDCGLSILEQLVAAKTGYVIQGHHLELYGRCPDCGQFENYSQLS